MLRHPPLDRKNNRTEYDLYFVFVSRVSSPKGVKGMILGVFLFFLVGDDTVNWPYRAA